MLKIAQCLASLVCVATFSGSSVAAEAPFPDRPITIVVSFPPGSANDLMGRVVAKRLTDTLAKPAVVENRPGAGGLIGAASVARAKPDGYTLLLGSTSMVTSQLARKAPGYDVSKDFSPVGMVASAAMGVFVNTAAPANSLAEFIAYSKKNPGKIFYSSSGEGGIMHVEGERFSLETGIKATHVPFSGGAPAVQALLGNEVQYVVIDVGAALPMQRAGKLRLLAAGAPQRLALFPDAPTFSESGLSFSPNLWYGIFAPVSTPANAMSVLRDELAKLLKDADYRTGLQNLNAQLPTIGPEQFKVIIDRDLAAYRDVMVKAKIEAQ